MATPVDYNEIVCTPTFQPLAAASQGTEIITVVGTDTVFSLEAGAPSGFFSSETKLVSDVDDFWVQVKVPSITLSSGVSSVMFGTFDPIFLTLETPQVGIVADVTDTALKVYDGNGEELVLSGLTAEEHVLTINYSMSTKSFTVYYNDSTTPYSYTETGDNVIPDDFVFVCVAMREDASSNVSATVITDVKSFLYQDILPESGVDLCGNTWLKVTTPDTTLIVEDGTGLADANSYVTVEYVDSYLQSINGSAEWDLLETAEKETLIKIATNDFDIASRWNGSRLTSTQSLAFPRDDFYDNENRLVTGLPELVKEAIAIICRSLVIGEDTSQGSVFLKSEAFGGSVDTYVVPKEIVLSPIYKSAFKKLKYYGYGRSKSSVHTIYRA